jgi:hypothetical protein
LILLVSCGKRKDITGGPKDEVRPEIVDVFPAEFSNIDNTDIEITFTKPMKRSSIANGLRIYPEIDNFKLGWIDNNVLAIKIKEDLPDTLNYYFELTESIKGYHNNKLDKSYKYVFHGGKLQDYSIRGNIVFEEKNDRNEEINLSLFAHDSTLIYSEKLTSDKLLITELNKEKYIVEAFIDKNDNNKYNYGKDPYFRREIEADSLDKFLTFNMTYVDTIPPILKKAKIINENQVEITFDEEIREIGDISISSTDSLELNINVIRNDLIGNKCYILCDFLDSLEYGIKFYSVSDQKSNVADSLLMKLSGEAISDTLSPNVVNILPRDGATISELKPEISIEFDEVLINSFADIRFVEIETGEIINYNYLNKGGKIIKVQPYKNLKNFMSYEVIVGKKTRDLKGNKIKEEVKSKFIPIIEGEL